MKAKPGFSSSIFPKIILGVLFLAAFSFVLVVPYNVKAQDNPTPTPSPNPTIVELENQIATQRAEIEDITDRLTDEERDRKYFDRDIQWQFAIAGVISSAIIALLAFAGFSNLKDLRTKLKERTDSWFEKIDVEWEKRSQILLDKAIYKIDIGNLPIYLPTGEGLEKNIFRLLKQRSFDNIDFYEKLDDFSEGIFIISLAEKNEEERKEILDNFKSFIDTNEPSGKKVGFIIFAPGRIRVPDDVMGYYDNLVTANYPTTVLSMVFVIARGLDIQPPEKRF